MSQDNVIFVEDNELQWVEDNDQQWGLVVVVGYGLNQIWTDANYVYAATVSGLNIIDIDSENRYAYINYSDGFDTVWANDDRVFVGSTYGGIKYVDKTCISGSIYSPYNITTCLVDYKSPPVITSLEVKYIHGNDNRLVCCTSNGVDVIKMGANGYRNYKLFDNAQKCFMTSTGQFYYTVHNGDVVIPTRWNDSGSNITLSNYNWTTTKSTTTWSNSSVKSLKGVSSGKWYWEFYPSGVSSACVVGVGNVSSVITNYCGIDTNSWGYLASNGKIYTNNLGQAYGNTWSDSNVIGVALDMDNGKIWFSVDGVWQNSGDPVAGTGEAFSGLTGTIYAMISHYYDGQSGVANFGQADFSYSAPSGFYSGLGVFSTDAWSVNIVNYMDWDWDVPDNFYYTNGDILAGGEEIKDIFVTESTSSNSVDNTLFVATTSGIYVIDEGDNDYHLYYAIDNLTVSGTSFIMAGTDNDFTAIWADYNSGIGSGILYAASASAFSIVDMAQNKVIDYYTTTRSGVAGEALLSDDIADINVSM